MPSLSSLLKKSWNFFKDQPVLISASLWMIFLPLLGMNVIGSLMNDMGAIGSENTAPFFGLLLCLFVLSVVLTWGLACVLLVGGKLLGAKAGRSRTSLKAVAKEARAFVVPLILTSILRGIVTCFYLLLLIIPGVIYSIRTTFYSIVLIEEGIAYRPALHRSRDIVMGKTGSVLVTLLLLLIVLFGPVVLIVNVLLHMLGKSIAILFLDSILTSVALVLFTLSMILLYGWLAPAKGPVMGGGKK